MKNGNRKEIARVDDLGMVTAVSPGECVITAACANGKQASCTVSVWEVEKVTGLEVVNATTSSIQFKWNKQVGVDGYQVYRYDPEKKVWDLLGDLEGENCNSYTDKELKSGTTYWYRVNAHIKTEDKDVFGDFSEYFKAKTVERKILSAEDITLSQTSYVYDGKGKTPKVTVKDGKIVLKAGQDYTVTYQNNKNAGKAKVIVKGKGDYQGTVTKAFTITVKKGTSHKVGSYQYKVTGTSTVSLTAVKNGRVTKATVPKTVKIGGRNFKVTAISSNAFKKNKKITTVKIGDNVKTIGAGAFENCQKLNKVTVGKGTAESGKNAFKNCKKLGNITIKSTKLNKVGTNALRNIKSNARIKVPARKLSAYQKLFQNKGQGKNVKIVK